MNDEEFKSLILGKLDLALFWLRMQSIPTTRTYFDSILDSDQKRQAYDMSDGTNTIDDIMNATGVKSKGTISTWWDDWLRKGIVKEAPRAGRKQKLIDLAELDLPPLEAR